MKIKHVYGNVLRLDIPLTIKIVTSEGGHAQETEEPFYPDTSKPVLVELANQYNITKYAYDATMTENVAHIEDYGGIKIGLYKVTVKCYDEQGQPYRYMARDIIEIVDATADAGIEAGIEFDSETYTLEGAVFISYGAGQVQSDWNEQDDESKAYIKNKPDLTQYATKNELREVEDEIPILPDHIVTDEYYVHTDNNYTDEEKEKLADLENYDDSGIRQELGGKVDKEQGKGLSTNDYTNEEKTKLANAITEEQDPTVPSWAKQSTKPSYNAQEVGALPNTTKYGSTIDLSMDSTTYVLTLSLKDQDGTVLNTKTVDFPIESVVVNGRYDAINKKIVLTLQSGSTIDVPVGDLIAGLQTEITSVNMLDADLVDDTNSSHKFVTAQEKTTWNNKSDFSGSYNDLENKPTIPSKTSDLENDSKFVSANSQIFTDAEKEQARQNIGAAGTGDVPTLPDNVSYFSNDSGEGIIPMDGIRGQEVAASSAMTVNPDVVTVITGEVGSESTITLNVPNDALWHVWDMFLTTAADGGATIVVPTGATLHVPSGYSIVSGKTYEIRVIGKGLNYYLAYGEFA